MKNRSSFGAVDAVFFGCTLAVGHFLYTQNCEGDNGAYEEEDLEPDYESGLEELDGPICEKINEIAERRIRRYFDENGYFNDGECGSIGFDVKEKDYSFHLMTDRQFREWNTPFGLFTLWYGGLDQNHDNPTTIFQGIEVSTYRTYFESSDGLSILVVGSCYFNKVDRNPELNVCDVMNR